MQCSYKSSYAIVEEQHQREPIEEVSNIMYALININIMVFDFICDKGISMLDLQLDLCLNLIDFGEIRSMSLDGDHVPMNCISTLLDIAKTKDTIIVTM